MICFGAPAWLLIYVSYGAVFAVSVTTAVDAFNELFEDDQ